MTKAVSTNYVCIDGQKLVKWFLYWMEIISLKLGSTVGNEWYSFPSKLLDVQHPVISGEIGGRLAAVPWLLPSVTASRISVSRRFLRRTHQLGILCWESPVDWYGMFLSSFLRRKTSFGYCFSETHILWFVYFLCLCKVKKTFGRFQLEAPRAYKCKQILGLCHSSPQMKNQCGMWKKPLWGKKCIQPTHECDD